MKILFSHLILAVLFVGCNYPGMNVEDIHPTNPTTPAFTAAAPDSCENGQPCIIDLDINEIDRAGDYSVSVITMSGRSTITHNGTPIDTKGEWMPFVANKGKLSVTPETTGILRICLQVKSPAGNLSKKQLIDITVTPAVPIAVDIICKTKVINLSPGARIPIHLSINKPDYAGSYTIKTILSKGRGAFYEGGQIIEDGIFHVDSTSIIEFSPDALGEYIIEFIVDAGRATTTTRTYFNVVQKLSVKSDVINAFTISGENEYNTEGELVTLTMKNYSGYNFVPEGWYDHTGKLLSQGNSCNLKLALNGPGEIFLKLKQRTVTLTRSGVFRMEFKYYLPDWRPASVFDHRLEINSSHPASDYVTFYYQEYRYKKVIPPVEEVNFVKPRLSPGFKQSNFFFRIDNIFTIYIRQSDNPDFIFNHAGHYVESKTTRYLIPATVIMQ